MFYYNSTHSEPSFQRRGFFFLLFETMHLRFEPLYGRRPRAIVGHKKQRTCKEERKVMENDALGQRHCEECRRQRNSIVTGVPRSAMCSGERAGVRLGTAPL